MAEKKALIITAPSISLSGSSATLDKLKKKGVILPNAQHEGLVASLQSLGAVAITAEDLAKDDCLSSAALLTLEGGEEAISAAFEAVDRRTLLVVLAADGIALHGLAMDSKAGTVERSVNAQDIAVTIATIVDVAIDKECTGAIIYQAMKNPNLKLEEIKKLKEAIIRMESVLERDSREPWEKHDCA